MGKLPGFIFYPGDWLKDPELRRCTKAEKGVWIDMLAVSFECSDRGVFATGGSPWTDQEIAAAIGGDIAENLLCLQELLRKGVARRNGSGAVFSARMVRDESNRAADKTRKKNQRDREKCPVEVTHRVTPLSVNETEDVFEVAVVPVIKPKFTLEQFDAQSHFIELCKVYPKPNNSILGMQAYERAIEPLVCNSRPDRNEIAGAILQAAAAYKQAKRLSAKKFIPEMIAWLDKGIWQQDPEMWEESSDVNTGKQTAADRYSAAVALRRANAANGGQLEKS